MKEKYLMVGIRFDKYSSTYHYKYAHNISGTLLVNDLVIVRANGVYKVVEVTHIGVVEDPNPKFEYAWIVDVLRHQRYLEREAENQCKRPTRL